MLRITVPQKCDASVFAVCQMPKFHGQHASAMFPVVSLPRTLIRTRSFDVLPSSRFLGQGLCERCQRCIQVPPQFGTRVFLDAIFIIPPQFKVSTTQGARWWSERRCNNCHLLSSVDPVLYCYTNATHVPTVLSLVSSAASVFASSLGQFMDCVLHCLASQSGCIHWLCTTAAASLLFASFIMLYFVL